MAQAGYSLDSGPGMPQKCPFPRRRFVLAPNTWFLEPTQVYNPYDNTSIIIVIIIIIFTARCYASAVLAMGLCLSVRVRVRVRVRLIQVGVLLKRLNGGSHKQHHTIPQRLYFSDAKDLREIRPGSPPTRAPNAGGMGQNRRLLTNSSLYLENGTR